MAIFNSYVKLPEGIQNLVQGRPFPDILMALFSHRKFYLLIHPAENGCG